MSEVPSGAGRYTRCPRCGLSLQVMARPDGVQIAYDFLAWDRACATPHLGGPSMCLGQVSEPAVAVSDRVEAGSRADPVFEPLR